MIVKFLVFLMGAASASLGMLYLARPDKIFKVNFWMRELIFNDAYVNLRRKKIGSFFVIVGLVLLCAAL